MREITGIDRRRLLALMGAAAVGGPAAAAPLARDSFFGKNNLPIGIQLYSLGDLPRNDLAGTLKQIADMGYKTVELAGYLGKTPAQLRAAFDAAGLTCSSAHVGIRAGTPEEPGLLGDLGKLAADLHVIGATDIVVPSLTTPAGLPAKGMAEAAAMMTEDHWKQAAAQMNGLAAQMKKSGFGFGFHNHNVEFVSVGRRTGWDILIAETDPKLVSFELDIGWAAAAGLDPVAVFAKNPGRYRLAHVKDVKASTQPNFNLKMDPTEVGSGKLDWARILPAAYRAGVRKFFVEQEPPFAESRIVSAAKNYSYLSTLKA
jgi:sugar phosphate isomerase/epimerase